MSQILPLLAILASSIYTGATFYIAIVEHPSRLVRPIDAALTEWFESVRRTPRYAASALVGAAAGLAHGELALGSPWTWGSILLLAVVPFTVITMLPIQRRLAGEPLHVASPETRAQLVRWGRLHAVRAGLGMIALLLFLCAALGIL